jgi:hypothetical protein
MKPVVFETFRKIDAYHIGSLTQVAPDCFNQVVSVRKYRVTIEEIDEPDAVIIERIKKLWLETKNHHDWEPLKNEAKKVGLVLKHDDRRRPK